MVGTGGREASPYLSFWMSPAQISQQAPLLLHSVCTRPRLYQSVLPVTPHDREPRDALPPQARHACSGCWTGGAGWGRVAPLGALGDGRGTSGWERQGGRSLTVS